MFQVILGSFGVFLNLNYVVSGKWQVLERNIHLNLYVIQFYVVILCDLLTQSNKGPARLVLNYFFFIVLLDKCLMYQLRRSLKYLSNLDHMEYTHNPDD